MLSPKTNAPCLIWRAPLNQKIWALVLAAIALRRLILGVEDEEILTGPGIAVMRAFAAW